MSKILNIYAQDGPGDCAIICGTSEALLALAKCIKECVSSTKQVGSKAFNASDNIQFDVVIIANEKIDDNLRLPYTSEQCRDISPEKTEPINIIIDRLPDVPK